MLQIILLMLRLHDIFPVNATQRQTSCSGGSTRICECVRLLAFVCAFDARQFGVPSLSSFAVSMLSHTYHRSEWVLPELSHCVAVVHAVCWSNACVNMLETRRQRRCDVCDDHRTSPEGQHDALYWWHYTGSDMYRFSVILDKYRIYFSRSIDVYLILL